MKRKTFVGAVFLVCTLEILLTGCIITLFRKSERIRLRQERAKKDKYKKDLLEAAKSAEAANRAKTEFLQRMSHDIRTPCWSLLTRC